MARAWRAASAAHMSSALNFPPSEADETSCKTSLTRTAAWVVRQKGPKVVVGPPTVHPDGVFMSGREDIYHFSESVGIGRIVCDAVR